MIAVILVYYVSLIRSKEMTHYRKLEDGCLLNFPPQMIGEAKTIIDTLDLQINFSIHYRFCGLQFAIYSCPETDNVA